MTERAIATLETSASPPQSMTRLIWKRFLRHPGAVAGMVILSIVILAVLFAGLSPYDPDASDMSSRFEPPSVQHPMGTDALGRDMLTRVLYGGRVSLAVGFSVVLITLLIGIPLGAISGYSGGWLDNILMRITDAALTLPSLLVLILLSAVLREVNAPFLEDYPVLTIAAVIGLLSWMFVARMVRAAYISIREQDFVIATRTLGATDLRIMIKHILPNAVGPIIVLSTLEIGYAILEESGLSYLGFGIQPPTASWGNLLSNAQDHMIKHPWMAIFPGLMIFLTIISINYIGDGLRDAFDPFKVFSDTGENQ
jgi:peptide/nickel transport system permease protein